MDELQFNTVNTHPLDLCKRSGRDEIWAGGDNVDVMNSGRAIRGLRGVLELDVVGEKGDTEVAEWILASALEDGRAREDNVVDVLGGRLRRGRA